MADNDPFKDIKGIEYSGPPKDETQKDDKNNEKIVKKLVKFAEQNIGKLVVDKSNSYAVYGIVKTNNHKEAFLLGSPKSNKWLQHEFNETKSDVCSKDQAEQALEILEGRAIFGNADRETIYNRVAMVHDKLYYDMASNDWKIIKITAEGWEPVDFDIDLPIFERKQHQVTQSYPVYDHSFNALEKLCGWLRIKQSDKLVFKVHLISLFIERYPMPIMVFTGEQGSIKSTLTKTIKRIVDPSSQELQEIPEKNDDWAIQMYNRYLSAFDNITGFDQRMSDRFCRVITGMGVSKRQLYKDSDEVILNMTRKVVLNGISPSLDWPDFRDRCIFYETTQIKENQRLTLEEFNEQIDNIIPQLMGQVFTILSGAMKNYFRAKADLKGKMQRMSDFTVWGESISRALGNGDMVFLKEYKKRLLKDSMSIISNYPMFQLVQELMKNRSKFVDTMGNFYNWLKTEADNKGIDIKSKQVRFPGAAHRIGQHLKTLQPTFRKIGLEFFTYTYTKRDGDFTVGSTIVEIVKNDEGSFSKFESNQGSTGSTGSTFENQARKMDKNVEPTLNQGSTEAQQESTDSRHEINSVDSAESAEPNSADSLEKQVKKSDYWSTPPEIFEWIKTSYNVRPALDVCANDSNKKCSMFFSESDDGLKQSWPRDSWCNPPYSQTGQWVAKCYNEHIRNNVTVTALIMKDETTSYWKNYIENKAEVHTYPKRIRFIDPETNKPGESARFVSAVVVWRKK